MLHPRYKLLKEMHHDAGCVIIFDVSEADFNKRYEELLICAVEILAIRLYTGPVLPCKVLCCIQAVF